MSPSSLPLRPAMQTQGVNMELLFLLTVLAAFRPTGSDLPAPGNVRIDSYNMEHILRWDALEVRNEKLPVMYDVEFQTADHVKELCAVITETWCNFTGRIPYFHRGRLKVRAQLGAQRSDWAQTQEFQASKHTIIGPVKSLALRPNVDGLTVQFLPPFPSVPSDWDMDYVLHYWKKNSLKQNIVHLYSSTTYKLRNLEPWTEYCVQVNVSTGVIDGQTSEPVCATTLGTDWTVPVVLVIILVLCVIAIAVYILPKHSSRIKDFLQGSHSIPLHFQQDLEDPSSRDCVAVTNLSCEEECDYISVVESDVFCDGNEETSSNRIYRCSEET